MLDVADSLLGLLKQCSDLCTSHLTANLVSQPLMSLLSPFYMQLQIHYSCGRCSEDVVP